MEIAIDPECYYFIVIPNIHTLLRANQKFI